jgi:hypothetical protein
MIDYYIFTSNYKTSGFPFHLLIANKIRSIETANSQPPIAIGHPSSAKGRQPTANRQRTIEVL